MSELFADFAWTYLRELLNSTISVRTYFHEWREEIFVLLDILKHIDIGLKIHEKTALRHEILHNLWIEQSYFYGGTYLSFSAVKAKKCYGNRAF